MQDFETQADDSEATGSEEAVLRSKAAFRDLLKRFILLISFGPGVLGFLWMIGRIVRR
ncbi:hypothetical protein BH11CYA1_BH11CYA1_05710 [soil metagenome]